MRGLRTAVSVAAVLAASAVWAQQSVDVVIAGRIVARIRDKGAYASLAERATKIDQRIADVISFEDTQKPQVSLKRVGGLYHVFVGKRDVIAVFPADAKPQKIDPKALAAIWMKNIKTALPFATPVTKLKYAGAGKPPLTPPKTGGSLPIVPHPGGTKPPSGSVTPAGLPAPGTEPGTEMVTQAPGANTTPTGETVPAATATSQPPEPKATPRSAALLLLLDAFNSVRVLDENEYLSGRDRLAGNLLENLEPYMGEARTQGVTTGTPQPPRPIQIVQPPKPPSVAGTQPKPPTVTPKPTGPSVPAVPTGPSVTSTKPGVTPGPKPPKPGDAAYVKVPQKQRIQRKFTAAAGPYDQLKQSGGGSLAQVSDLLKQSRAAYAAGDFDTSEAEVDQALQLMGVPIPK